MTHHSPFSSADLSRLLGPVAEQVSCEVCFDLLDEFVENDLSGGDRMPAMRAHLEGCPACREEFESLRALVRAGPPAT